MTTRQTTPGPNDGNTFALVALCVVSLLGLALFFVGACFPG